MALPPIQSTTILGKSDPPVHEYHVWIEVEETDENGDHVTDWDWNSYGKLGTYRNLAGATARAVFVEWLVNSAQYVQSPDGLNYWIAR